MDVMFRQVAVGVAHLTRIKIETPERRPGTDLACRACHKPRRAGTMFLMMDVAAEDQIRPGFHQGAFDLFAIAEF